MPSLIHDLVRAQADRTPHASAVVAHDATLTYGELDRRANALAGRLQDHGVGPEVLVGVSLEKSPAFLTTILAVLKAGGAYVPLDPAAPARLADVPVRLVVARGRPLSKSVPPGAELLMLDEDGSPAADRATFAPNRPVGPGNLAYVIYTSGSTGGPKGVAVTHGSLVASTRARLGWYPAPAAFLLLSSITFDSAVAGIFGTLTRGGALHLPIPGTEADAGAVDALIERCRIDALLTLPSHYELLLDAAAPGQLDSLRWVAVAGERCPAGLPLRSRAVAPNVELFNEYGPTEATVWSTVWRAPQEGLEGVTTVPIGRPIDGVRVAVVDASGAPVPDGTPGELYIGGATLARGYLGRPELTAAAFVPDRSGPPGARCYRTGDLVRRRIDGGIEFLGRLDRQLKVRGYRVEPGEIEDAIRRYDGVRQAVVVARPGSLTLVAFIVGEEVDPVAVRAFLGEFLSAHLMPAEIRRIDALPRTPNGKVDEPALQALTVASAAAIGGPGADRSPTERTVARVWCDVLGVAQIERGRDFFELGGSLAAVRVALQLSRLFDTQVPLLWVYEGATVEYLAQWLMSNVVGAAQRAQRWLATEEERQTQTRAGTQ